jgi:hypothetical protein
VFFAVEYSCQKKKKKNIKEKTKTVLLSNLKKWRWGFTEVVLLTLDNEGEGSPMTHKQAQK